MNAELLLVDDDPLIRTVVGDNLADHGFLVRTAANERQAMALLDEFPGIGVALVDYCLPRPVGIGLCRTIAAQHPRVAVALYTAHDELAGARLDGDNIPVLSKNVRMDQLVEAVEDLMDGRKPSLAADAAESRIELLWQRELKRETVQSLGRAMHNHFDRTIREPLPATLSDTVMRLFRSAQ